MLFSGGIDSSVLSLMLANRNAELLFVDYGQMASRAERKAAETLAALWKRPLVRISIRGLRPAIGEILGRNALLVHVAFTCRPRARRIHLGIHAESLYRDCGPEFVELMQGMLDFHTGGDIRLSAPLIDLSKAEILKLAQSLALPLDLTHSCEAADEPCGKCESCRDREVLGVS